MSLSQESTNQIASCIMKWHGKHGITHLDSQEKQCLQILKWLAKKNYIRDFKG